MNAMNHTCFELKEGVTRSAKKAKTNTAAVDGQHSKVEVAD